MAVAEREETERLTIRFEDAENGWIAARIEEVPAAISQGRTREEARANVIDALRDLTHRQSAVERAAAHLRRRAERLAGRAASRLHALTR